MALRRNRGKAWCYDADGSKRKKALTDIKMCSGLRSSWDHKAVVDAWPTLPEALKVGIAAMVKAATNLSYRPRRSECGHALGAATKRAN
jgi:hypothetical protein